MNEENTQVETRDIIEKFRKFEKNSYSHFKNLFENIRKDRKFISGKQYSEDDKKFLGEDFKDATLNVVKNAIRTIVNSYSPYRYQWDYKQMDGAFPLDEPTIQSINKNGQNFLANPDNCTAAVEALTNAVGTGLGVMVFSNDYDIDGSVKPVLYSIPDVTNVRLDPNATKLNAADATEAAIIELKKKDWLRNNYGYEIVTDDAGQTIDISEEYDKKEYAPLITYYVKDGMNLTYYKMVGETILETGALPYSYIPVIPVFGEQTWDDDKITYEGVTTLMRSIQRLINYSYRQLLIRCSKVPKNTWAAEAESIEGYEKYYQNADKSLNPLLMYHKWSTDGKRELAPPTRLSNVIEFEDVSALMQNALGLTNTIIGIPATGLETNVEKTATEVLTNLKTFNNNIRNYIQHLRASLMLVGLLFVDYIYQQPMYGKIKVDVVQGPDEAMAKQEARVALQQYVQLATTDQDRQKLLLANINVERDNQYVAALGQMLQPIPTESEMQAQMLLGQAGEEMKQKDAQILELQKQVTDLTNEQKLNAYSLNREITLAKLKHEQELEKITLEAQLKAQDPGEQAKTQAEIVKAEASIEKSAIDLERDKVKASQPQVVVEQPEVK